ncbi:MAG: hypothetical protein GMKNLPBB_00813 [Myxococcota bacterium]|nr:hypothetical protein [Myxococcota bacterium]
MNRKWGEYKEINVLGETVKAFIPPKLPPERPPLEMPVLHQPLLEASQAIEVLNVASDMVPSMEQLILGLHKREATITSQIEGTQATLLDLLETEAGKESNPDIQEITNYLKALQYVERELADEKGLPLSMRLLNNAHFRLMQGVRGELKHPGEIRRSQNWIGGARPGRAVYVPPPAENLPDLLTDLEHYIHQKDETPPLLRIGMVHAQFEAIHPYLDGNGRMGRLLIGVLAREWRVIRQPVLHLSSWFKQHRREYYRLLDAAHADGRWEEWLTYFLTGAAWVARETTELIRGLHAVISEDRLRVLEVRQNSVLPLRLFELIPAMPVFNANMVEARLSVSTNAALRTIQVLEMAGVVRESSGKSRNRVYRYQRYLDLLLRGAELPMPE